MREVSEGPKAMRVNLREGYKVLRLEGAKEFGRHAKTRPERGTRMKRRKSVIDVLIAMPNAIRAAPARLAIIEKKLLIFSTT